MRKSRKVGKRDRVKRCREINEGAGKWNERGEREMCDRRGNGIEYEGEKTGKRQSMIGKRM
jgi:hypothetical protein